MFAGFCGYAEKNHIYGRRKGGRGAKALDFEIISKKTLFFHFRGVKIKFHHFWPPHVKNFGKIPYCPPLEKKSFRRPWPHLHCLNRYNWPCEGKHNADMALSENVFDNLLQFSRMNEGRD